MRHPIVTLSFFLATIIATGGAQGQVCTTPPDGMVGWWPGDNNANDITLGMNHGAGVGNIGFIDPGKVGPAFSISTDPGYVQVPGSPALEPSHTTVDAWVRAGQSPGQFRYIVAKGADGCLAASYGLYTALNGGLQFYVYDGTDYVLSPDAGVGVWNGAWHHVAGTYDGSAVRLYVDGAQVGNGTSTSIGVDYALPTDQSFVIGNYLDQGTCPTPVPFTFVGDIDEVELFNRALSQAEIQAIHDAGSAGKCKRIKVAIDIKPGEEPNSINLGSAGVVPVAILSSADFDATTIDPFTVDLNGASVKLVGKKNVKPLCHEEDANGDNLLDFVCQVYTVEFIIEPGETMAELTAETSGGNAIVGHDLVRIVP